ncbi:UNVERIFIED_CONTAM: hypothetical protein Sradi_6131600 [Sesamum radiatum]|uniref:Uncharacterized protein n=1 Tax=Sesamum radiatum TaxID=300843 RepID=A0AAW2KL13_SESRA
MHKCKEKSGGKCPAAYRFARSKQKLLDEAKDSLAKAQHRMKKYADMRVVLCTVLYQRNALRLAHTLTCSSDAKHQYKTVQRTTLMSAYFPCLHASSFYVVL